MTSMKYILLPLILISFSVSNAHASTENQAKCSALLKGEESFFHKEKAKDLEIQLSLAIHRLLTNKGGMLLYGKLPKESMKEVFNFTTGNRKYAQEVLGRLDQDQKSKIISYLYASYINHFIPSSSDLTEADWEFNTEVVHGPWLNRLVLGKKTENVLTKVFAAGRKDKLRQFVEAHIDSFIKNGISMKVVEYPLILQRALSLCVGVACSYIAQDDPTIAFSILAAFPAREILRRNRPFVIGFESDFK